MPGRARFFPPEHLERRAFYTFTRNEETGERQMDRKLVDRILKDGKIDKAEMKVIAGYVADSHNLSKEEKLCLREIFTKLSSGEVRLET